MHKSGEIKSGHQQKTSECVSDLVPNGKTSCVLVYLVVKIPFLTQNAAVTVSCSAFRDSCVRH